MLASLSAVTQAAVAQQLETIHVSQGEILVREGEPADAMYIVVKGQLAVTTKKTTTKLAALGPGSVIGEAALVLGGRRRANLIAEDDVTVLALDRAAYEIIVTSHPQFKETLIELAVKRLERGALVTALHSLFGATSIDVIDALSDRCETVELGRGELLCRAGEPGDCCFVVLSGCLAVVGDEDEVVASLGPGELLGELALLLDSARTADVVATRNARVAKISRADFESCLLNDANNLLQLTRTLAERLARTAREQDSHPRTVALIPLGVTCDLSAFTTALHASLEQFGHATTVDCATASSRGYPEGSGRLLDRWFDMLRQEFVFTLLIADPELPDWTGHVLGAADLILIITDDDSPVAAPGELAHHERSPGSFDPPRWLIRLHPVACALPSPSLSWLEALIPDFLLNVRLGATEHVDRLARLIARRAVGVTLSGGAARGFAHFGTIIALHDYGIPVDYLSGASAGSLAALLVAQEREDLRAQSKDRVEQLVLKGNPFTDITLPLFGVLRSLRISDALQRVFGDLRVENLWIPVRVAVTDLTHGVLRSHERGVAWRLALAGGSPPGLAVPVVVDGSVCCDAGVLDNLPLSLLGPECGVRIASIVSNTSEIIYDQDVFPSPWRVLWDWLLRRGHTPVPHIAQILMASAAISGSRSMAEAARNADLCFEPDLSAFGNIDFAHHAEMVEAARSHAAAILQDKPAAARIRSWVHGEPEPGPD